VRVRSLRRRELITVFGVAAAWPLAGRAQQREQIRRVGWLMPWSEADPLAQACVQSFTQALAGFGWHGGRNIQIDYRFALNDSALFKAYASELVGVLPHAVVASTPPAIMALHERTQTIPLVFVLVPDPVGQGLVQSLARPGGNITGFGVVDAPIMGKWLQLLKEAAPTVTRVGIIFNPDTSPHAPRFNRAIETAAPVFGVTITLAPVRDETAIEEAITTQAGEPGGGLICLPDSFSVTHAGTIVGAATRHGLPLIGLPPLVRAGGLISYFFDPIDAHAEAASYIDRILKGASPADLPVQQPTKYSLIINLKTAKVLGLTVPPSMLDLADEVIE
jgi:putative tryptophan/tyrosine transport system substrate-binding protein